MIDQDLINKCKSDIKDFGQLDAKLATELIENYIKVIEDNAQLHKERVFVVNGQNDDMQVNGLTDWKPPK